MAQLILTSGNYVVQSISSPLTRFSRYKDTPQREQNEPDSPPTITRLLLEQPQLKHLPHQTKPIDPIYDQEQQQSRIPCIEIAQQNGIHSLSYPFFSSHFFLPSLLQKTALLCFTPPFRSPRYSHVVRDVIPSGSPPSFPIISNTALITSLFLSPQLTRSSLLSDHQLTSFFVVCF